ncbi:MAG: hypothetical protein GEV03_07660 [Streptosporangiales bacterium]|nr:hypothetical protein [Streptosporangiales bacterium]
MSWGFDADLGLLADTAGEVGEAVTLARQMQQRADALRGEVATLGAPPVQQAARGFLERWGYGVRLIDDDTSWAADGLRACAEVYADVEQGVVDAMGSLASGLTKAPQVARDFLTDRTMPNPEGVADAMRDGIDTIRDVLG